MSLSAQSDASERASVPSQLTVGRAGSGRADALLFEKASGTPLAQLASGKHGASFALQESMGGGAQACRFVLRRTAPADSQ